MKLEENKKGKQTWKNKARQEYTAKGVILNSKYEIWNHGITLIALIITIIILIILAGISLNFVLGDDSIISTAVSAREKTIIESIRERLELVKGSTFIKEEGKANISKYFEQLSEEKIEPYNVTSKEELTDSIGVVQVNQKYSYLITFAENGDLQITYKGKAGEEKGEIGEISVALSGERTQSQLPIVLTATITNSKEEVNNAKWILMKNEEALGTEENKYTESTDSDTINLQFKDANTYYLHVLTTDRYGKKAETIVGPIVTTIQYHSHINSCYREGSHNSSCKGHSVWVDWVDPPYWGYIYDCGGHRYAACGKSGAIERCTISF